MITSTLTSKGQTTIPLEVRKALHLKPKQRLMYDIHGDQVILKPQGPTILDLFGSVQSPKGASSNWKTIEAVSHAAAGKRGLSRKNSNE